MMWCPQVNFLKIGSKLLTFDDAFHLQLSSADPLIAAIDLARTKYSAFICNTQINPTPMCILATKEQLDELIANCTHPQEFSVLHVDPTFNLGNFYGTPLVFSLKDYVSQCSKNSPTFVGPFLIHHTMEYASYHGFFNQLLGQLPEFGHVKAIGSDGETALCKAIEATLPAAVHLRCIKHLRDNIERKLKDMNFDQQAITELKADIFGTIVDGVHEQGLSDANDEDDFVVRLASLQRKWNAFELQHRAFKSGEAQTPTFHAWFHDHYHLNGRIFCKSVIQQPRIKAGMGNPPPAFYNNSSESINRVLKRQVDHKKCSLPHFIDEMHQLVTEQMNMLESGALSHMPHGH